MAKSERGGNAAKKKKKKIVHKMYYDTLPSWQCHEGC